MLTLDAPLVFTNAAKCVKLAGTERFAFRQQLVCGLCPSVTDTVDEVLQSADESKACDQPHKANSQHRSRLNHSSRH